MIAYLNRCVAELHDEGNVVTRPLVISKIENKEGVENFEAILKESDGKSVMVERNTEQLCLKD